MGKIIGPVLMFWSFLRLLALLSRDRPGCVRDVGVVLVVVGVVACRVREAARGLEAITAEETTEGEIMESVHRIGVLLG